MKEEFIFPEKLPLEKQEMYLQEFRKLVEEKFGKEKISLLEGETLAQNTLVKERRYQDAALLRDKFNNLRNEFVTIHEEIRQKLDEKYLLTTENDSG